MLSYSERTRRLRIFETDYGRDGGWIVECDGEEAALLVDPRAEEQVLGKLCR